MTINERGNEVYRDHEADKLLGIPAQSPLDRDRYYYDCGGLKNWRQFDTWQDASYFGIWVNIAERKTFTYAEGDRTLVICPTLESFQAELADAARCYGPPRPAAVSYDLCGRRVEYFDDRPTGDPNQKFGDSAIKRALA